MIQLIKSTKDIKYDYLLYIPDNIREAQIVVWGHGSTPDEVKYEDISDFIEPSFNNILSYCNKLNLVAVMPLLPRFADANEYPLVKFDSQIMTKEVMFDNYSPENEPYKRPDLEIVKMIESVKDMLKKDDVKVKEKIVIGGVSAGANMANRFSLLYPELVEFSLLLLSGIFMYPESKMNEVTLNYPFGTNNIDQLVNKGFNKEEFSGIKHFLYVGEQDNNPRNDIARFEFIAERDKQNIGKVIGLDSVSRTKNYANYLESLGIDVELYIEPELGHNVNGKVMDKTFGYLKDKLANI